MSANTIHHVSYVTQRDAEAVVESVVLATRDVLDEVGERALLGTLRVVVEKHAPDPDTGAPSGFYVQVTASVERLSDSAALGSRQ